MTYLRVLSGLDVSALIERLVVDIGMTPATAEKMIREACPGLENGVGYIPVPRCDSCLFWRQNITHGGECAAVEPRENRKAVVVWEGRLLTRADFGCVQWEQKS